MSDKYHVLQASNIQETFAARAHTASLENIKALSSFYYKKYFW